MSTVYHWGKWVDSEVPTTGVVDSNSPAHLMEEVFSDSAINLSFERSWKEFYRGKLGAYQKVRGRENKAPSARLVAKWEDEHSEEYNMGAYGSGETYLIGKWIVDSEGEYAPDLEGEYAAIVNFDSFTVQVVHSKWVRRCALCSPCYPGQADLDCAGDYLAYDLPAEIYGCAGDMSQNGDNNNPILRWIAEEQRAIGIEGDSVF